MSNPPIEIRKYPNRRYYNTRDSRHVTLEEIRDLIRDGNEIRVVDSRTEEDITVAVLTQILLEIESPKLAFFPSTFLQHLIRTNSDMYKNMTEGYFNNAMAAFARSPGATPGGPGIGFGLPFTGPIDEWQQAWMRMFRPASEAAENGAEPSAATNASKSEATANVDDLRGQVEELRKTVEELRKQGTK